MLKVLDDYDWASAFEYAGEKNYGNGSVDIRTPIGYEHVSRDSFAREDVKEIYGIHEGVNDEESWLLWGKLSDGRYFALNAWCDYTGWDCRAGGTVFVADDKDIVFEFGFETYDKPKLVL